MNKFKKSMTVMAIIMGMVAISQAQNIRFTLLSSTQSEAVVRVDFGTYQTETVFVNDEDMQKLIMADAYPVLKKGSPELLQTAFSLIVPEGSNPETEILDAQYTVVESFALAPSKGNLYRNVDPENVPYTKNADYQAADYLLGNAIQTGETYQLRDYQGMNFKVYPFDYNPVAQKLKIYSSVTVKVTFNSTRSVTAATKINRTFEAVYANQFLNYHGLRSTPVTEEGDILIICPENFMEAMQPYVDWKIRNGYNTEMVTVTAAGNNANAIKTYITNYYNEHNLAFVIIVGDNAQFPTPTVSGNKSDNYFTEIAGNDSYPDIILGKISAENVAQVETQVQRFIEYEQNPPETSHFPSFMGIASSQGPGDNNEYDYQHIRNINNKLQNYTYTSGYELFEGSQGGLDASGNPTAAMVTTGVNNGVGIISYCGHGDVQMWVTTSFNNSNVNSLTNVGMLPFILSVACVNGEYHTGTCFAEAWLRATHNGQPTGAVGFTGSTINQPWNSPMCAQDAMIDLLIGTNQDNQNFTFGGMFFNGMIKMLDVYNDVEVFRTWILFGDPTLQMRTAVPEQLEVTHNAILPAGTPSLTFSSAVENAKITVTHNNEVVATGRITGGEYTLTFNDTYLPTDTLKVLATATNYLPYEGTINFIPNEGPYVIIGDLTLTDKTLPFVNNQSNNLPEFGKTMTVTPQIINIGNQNASNVRINVSTEDEYITLNNPILTVTTLPSHDTLANSPTFTFSVKNVVPANHNAVIKMEIIFNNDTLRQSKSVKLYAPQLNIISLVIDDTETGNGNNKADYGETINCNFTIANTGNMPIVGGNIFFENQGDELSLQTDPIFFPAIDINGTTTVTLPVTVNSIIQEPTISYIKAGLWVNYFYASAYFPVRIGAVMEDWETGDFYNMSWQNTSSTPWTITTTSPFEGTYCAKSGTIGNSANTTLRVTDTATVSDSISFFYKVSSEQNYDKLTFKIDGQTKGEWSGNISWTRAAYPVNAGPHTYTWTYSKDYYGTSGKDCAYIDAIAFPCGKVNYPVSIQEIALNSDSYQVWPNPATDVLHLQLLDNSDNQGYTYQLLSLAGKLLQGGRLSDNTEIDVRSLVSGIYFLRIENSLHQTQTVKFIKK
ncbi:MAG: T9SS type A sorting domain-containing protein [Bacteroidales bacterium]|nr:T9SS type A sorting domain-containing protein [Bacteroidales bacterium]